MEASCVRQTELPHTSRLFSDFLYRFDQVQRFYEDGRAAASYPDARRAELVAALAEINGPGPSLDALGRPGTVAVVTGQQVGLLSGPAYTVYKALTAVKLARQLTEGGTPAVPVFWLATEDHDFAEVNHAWVFDAEAQPVRVGIAGAGASGEPVGNVKVDGWEADAFAQALRELPFSDEVTARVSEAYRPGRSMGQAFHALLRDLLAPYGLLFVDPLQPSIRALAAPFLRDAVDAAPDLGRLLLERNRELAAAGYHAQVHVDEKTSLFFVLEGAHRNSLKRQNGIYAGEERRYAPSELRDIADRISPNALLRPVVQDYMLPTAAYVGGPAELAYFAQSQVLYHELLGGMPRLVARSGFTLVDRRSRKLMDRYRLTVQDFFHGEENLLERMAAQLVPPPLRETLASVHSETERLLERLRESVGAFDPTLGAAAAKSQSKILHQLRKIESKAGRESMRRSERAARDAAYLAGNIFPHKHLQERFYSILPFLARHGMPLIDDLYSAIHLDCSDHIVLHLDS